MPFSVSFDGGISKWSGLLDIALEGGFVQKPSNGWYAKTDLMTGAMEDKKYRLKDTDTESFWNPILKSKQFQEYVKKTYMVSSTPILGIAGDIEDDKLDPE